MIHAHEVHTDVDLFEAAQALFASFVATYAHGIDERELSKLTTRAEIFVNVLAAAMTDEIGKPGGFQRSLMGYSRILALMADVTAMRVIPAPSETKEEAQS